MVRTFRLGPSLISLFLGGEGEEWEMEGVLWKDLEEKNIGVKIGEALGVQW